MENNRDKDLEDHRLEVVLESDKIQSYLKRPGDRAMSTLITFTPEGIALQGDLVPSLHGDVALFYDVGWFSKLKSKDYLCSKFFSKTFVPSKAIASLEEEFKDNPHAMRGLEHYPIRTPEDVCDFLDDYLEGEEWDEIGMGYDPDKADLLYAIHKAFCREYGRLKGSE